MALINEFEKQGNFLFKYRGQFPVLLFVLAIPFIYFHRIESVATTYVLTYVSIALSFLGFIIRCYTIGTTPRGTSGRNTKEQVADELNSTGMYSLLRHPLYLGNYLMWIGIVLFSFNIYLVIIVSLLYWIYYERIMFAEERFLENKFGQDYLDWASHLPAFFPRLGNFKGSNIPFSFKSVLRREYSGILATVLGFCYIEFLRNYFINDKLLLSSSLVFALLISLALALVLRTIKRTTSFLEEEGRF